VIAITFALPAESSRFVACLHDKKRVGCGDTEIIQAKIGNRVVAVFHTGVGEKICRRRVAQLLQDRQFDLLISAGFAGALSDELHVGDVLLAQNFSTVNAKAARAVLSDEQAHTANLVTVSRILDSQEDRLRIAKQSGAAAADMETEFISRACAERGVPLLSLRVISDTPARPLPAPPSVLFDIDEQKTKLARLSRYLLQHPSTLPRMILFARQVRKARRALTHALETLLRSGKL
jgi:nucleoside phosphorylase